MDFLRPAFRQGKFNCFVFLDLDWLRISTVDGRPISARDAYNDDVVLLARERNTFGGARALVKIW